MFVGPVAESEYHCLLSHQWGSGQDQAGALKLRLQALELLRGFIFITTCHSYQRVYSKLSDLSLASRHAHTAIAGTGPGAALFS